MEIDYTQWPYWLVAVLLFANLFRDPLSALVSQALPDHFKHYATRQADREEHLQDIEEVKLNAQLQGEAVAELRKSWREENLMAILQSKDEFERELFRELTASFNKLADQQARTNELLTSLNTTMRRYVNGASASG